MELDFKKQKDRFAKMADAELLARIRDPDVGSSDKMLAEAEISRRGLDRGAQIQPAPTAAPASPMTRKGINPISLVIIVTIALSILAGILDDMGIDWLEWLREFFSGAD